MRNFGFKTDNTAPAVGGILTADEDNCRFSELVTACTSTGIALDPAIGPDTRFNMLAEAAARSASGGVYGSCTGSANTYVVAISGSFVAPRALFDGMQVVTFPSATNTGASTATVFSLASKAVRRFNDLALTGKELIAGRPSVWIYSTTANSAAGAWLIVPWSILLASSLLKPTRSVFTTGTAATYTVPANTYVVRVRVWGGGGGGGFGAAGGAASGGGGAAFGDKYFDVNPADTFTYTVGVAGAAGISGTGPGSGTASSITYSGTTYTAGGGTGGTNANAGQFQPSVAGGATSGGAFDTAQQGEPSKKTISGYSGAAVIAYAGDGGGCPSGGYGGLAATGAANSGNVPGGGGGGSGGAAVAGAGARGEIWFEAFTL